MPKYIRRETLLNDRQEYENFLNKRGLSEIVQNLRVSFKRDALKKTYAVREHTWSKGDRLYKLSHKYYGEKDFWWLIAIWNGKPTDADYIYGSVIQIPFPALDLYREIVDE